MSDVARARFVVARRELAFPGMRDRLAKQAFRWSSMRSVRLLVLAVFAVVLLVSDATLAASAARVGAERTSRLSSVELSVLSALNATRAGQGLAPLRVSIGLSSAAKQHSGEMVRLGYFSHDSAGGSSFDSRIARSYPFSANYRHWKVGENLVWEAPDLDAGEAMRLWMASPEHRKNILDPSWTEIGISAVHAYASPGAYDGNDVTVITTDFGFRS